MSQQILKINLIFTTHMRKTYGKNKGYAHVVCKRADQTLR